MKAKPLMAQPRAWLILAIVVLLSSCAATDDNTQYNFGRDSMIQPTAGRDTDFMGNPSREYRETHPVNSFDDFDQQFPNTSSKP